MTKSSSLSLSMSNLIHAKAKNQVAQFAVFVFYHQYVTSYTRWQETSTSVSSRVFIPFMSFPVFLEAKSKQNEGNLINVLVFGLAKDLKGRQQPRKESP